MLKSRGAVASLRCVVSNRAAGLSLPRACAPENVCAEPRVIRRQRLTFWTVAALLLGLLLVPVVVPLFYQ